MLLQTTILGMPLMRFVTVYIAQGLIAAIFLFLAIKILKRDTKRLNVIFSSFYIAVSIGIILNMFYAPIQNSVVGAIGGTITVFCTIFGFMFLVIFELILLKSEKVFTPSKQILILIIQGALGSVLFFLALIPDIGIKVDLDTEWVPEWNLPYFLYAVISVTCSSVIPSTLFALRINKKFEDPQLKKKWKNFIVGYFLLVGFLYSIFLNNFLARIGIDVRTAVGVLGLFLVIIGGYLLYNGVGRQIEK